MDANLTLPSQLCKIELGLKSTSNKLFYKISSCIFGSTRLIGIKIFCAYLELKLKTKYMRNL